MQIKGEGATLAFLSMSLASLNYFVTTSVHVISD
jgi:hypothetical protein